MEITFTFLQSIVEPWKNDGEKKGILFFWEPKKIQDDKAVFGSSLVWIWYTLRSSIYSLCPIAMFWLPDFMSVGERFDHALVGWWESTDIKLSGRSMTDMATVELIWRSQNQALKFLLHPLVPMEGLSGHVVSNSIQLFSMTYPRFSNFLQNLLIFIGWYWVYPIFRQIHLVSQSLGSSQRRCFQCRAPSIARMTTKVDCLKAEIAWQLARGTQPRQDDGKAWGWFSVMLIVHIYIIYIPSGKLT